MTSASRSSVRSRGLVAAHSHYDDFDRAMIEFVLLWAPFGAPPSDEILPRFGILSYELPERIRQIGHRCRSGNVGAADRTQIIRALRLTDRLSSQGYFTDTGLESRR